MKKFFYAVGMISLICLSFIYTEKTSYMVREVDTLMVDIKKASDNFIMPSIEAVIDKNTIIPGLNGKKVNIDASYLNMKKLGYYNASMLKYDEVSPKVSLKDNFDKYIINGNPKKKAVSFIFLVEDSDDITPLLKILEEKKVKGNFFIDSDWVENNMDTLKSLANKYGIGNISNSYDYKSSDFIWLDTIIKKATNKKTSYCYSEKDGDYTLEVCPLNKNYTIRPGIIIENNPYREIKENITNGSIISFKINDKMLSELSTIITFLNSKDYQILTLDELLQEKRTND